MKRFLIGLSGILFLVATFLGGGQAGAEKRVAWVFPGTINDLGFNQSGYEALMRLKKRGIKVAFSENTPPPKFVSTLRNYAAQGYEVVVGQGYEFGDPIMKVAPKYPKTKFINIVGGVNADKKQKNVLTLQIGSNESGYVVGALAGLMTKTNRIGAIGGARAVVVDAVADFIGGGAGAGGGIIAVIPVRHVGDGGITGDLRAGGIAVAVTIGVRVPG